MGEDDEREQERGEDKELLPLLLLGWWWGWWLLWGMWKIPRENWSAASVRSSHAEVRGA